MSRRPKYATEEARKAAKRKQNAKYASQNNKIDKDQLAPKRISVGLDIEQSGLEVFGDQNSSSRIAPSGYYSLGNGALWATNRRH